MNLRDLLFPRSCLQCHRPGRYLCEQCISKVPISSPLCPYCNYYSLNGKTHIKCESTNGLDGHISVWRYNGIVRKGIHALKYRFAYDIASEFVDHFSDSVLAQIDSTMIIPIPLHRKRENWRGFNQSALLAQLIAKKLNCECVENALIRIENTTPQAQLGRKERVRNLRGKFAVNPHYSLRVTHYESLVLVDDVWTTGSTMKEAAKVLKKAGAKKVWGFTLAS